MCPWFSAVDEDGMDCLDNERRPHFPQFSYSASGREWTVRHHSDIITAGHRRDPQLLDRPRMTLTWRISPLLLSSSPLQSASLLFVCESLQTKPILILRCGPRGSEVQCDPLRCDVISLWGAGATPMACCVLTRVDPSKHWETTTDRLRQQQRCWHRGVLFVS